jgi:hypothetical protein
MAAAHATADLAAAAPLPWLLHSRLLLQWLLLPWLLLTRLLLSRLLQPWRLHPKMLQT